MNRLTPYCLGLEVFPKRGMRRDDIVPGLRIIGFERRFAIAFVATEDLVLIEGVFHGGQDYEAAYRERDEGWTDLRNCAANLAFSGAPCSSCSP
ncbi:type II toxin-antitoxin system RelE/ParE family toxin [Roseococcus sp. SYP-B2431]|uniref:type II toxin-antitoxin system RelE/ParE family toxin n=1 Tax=Roseococcus sp. SYP-B2431 TaxID=2496640 RepID=UPI00103952B3|nr:type II toxin-antitoxin system RelE/ParE family toxin [Roseococcus sp. SYP-B2431]